MDASVCDPPAAPEPIERSAVRGHAEYVDMYDGNQLCGNCTHHYHLHN